MATKINGDETLTVRDLLEALASDAVHPDAPVVTAVLDLNGYLQNLSGIRLHVASGAVVLDSGKHSGCANEEEVSDDELVHLL